MTRWLLSAAFVLGPVLAARAQESPNSDTSKETFDLLQAYYRYEAEQYDFQLDEAGAEKLTLEPTVMTWTGQDYAAVSGTVAPNSGGVYVWTYQGRAAVAGGIGSFPFARSRDVFHEFAALIERPPQPTAMGPTRSFEWAPTGMKAK